MAGREGEASVFSCRIITTMNTVKNHVDDPHSRFWSTCTDVQPWSNPQRDGAGCLVGRV